MPCMVAAIRPSNESGPFAFIISVVIARALLPETGRIIARGSTSNGILKTFSRGVNTFPAVPLPAIPEQSDGHHHPHKKWDEPYGYAEPFLSPLNKCFKDFNTRCDKKSPEKS